MKKMLLSQLPVLGLIFAGVFLFGSVDTFAQQTSIIGSQSFSDQLYAEPIGPFVSPAIGIEKLNAETTAQKNALENLVPGTVAFKQMNAKYTYFSAVRDYIIKGAPVGQAIVDALKSIGADSLGISLQELLAYKQEVINVLKL